MRCFVDTSAFLAVIDRSDRYHVRASELWSRLLGDPQTALVSTNYVLVETMALIQGRMGLAALRSFSSDVQPILQVIWIDQILHERAVAGLLSQFRRRLSLVDCSSFEVMRDLGIQMYFAFDRDFDEQGFQPLDVER